MDFDMRYGGRETAAVLAVMASALAWGVLWIPLRGISETGVPAVWTIVLFYLMPLALLLPYYYRRRRQLLDGGWTLQIAGMLSGVSMVLYAGALLFTGVVNAMLLFYLIPIWSTLLARVTLGETITLHRWITITLGISGLFVIFRIDSSIPVPGNSGDWMGLFAGLIWAFASVRINGDDRNQVPEYTLV